MIGDMLDARDFVTWRINVIAACRAGLPAPPAPRPPWHAVAAHRPERPVSEAAEYVERQARALLAARVYVEAVGVAHG